MCWLKREFLSLCKMDQTLKHITGLSKLKFFNNFLSMTLLSSNYGLLPLRFGLFQWVAHSAYGLYEITLLYFCRF